MGINFKKVFLSEFNDFKLTCPNKQYFKGIISLQLPSVAKLERGHLCLHRPGGRVCSMSPAFSCSFWNVSLSTEPPGLPALHLLPHLSDDLKGFLVLSGLLYPALLNTLAFWWNRSNSALISGCWQHADSNLKICLLPPHMTKYKGNCSRKVGSFEWWLLYKSSHH